MHAYMFIPECNKTGELFKKSIVWGTLGGGFSYRMFIVHGMFWHVHSKTLQTRGTVQKVKKVHCLGNSWE
eukprot:6328335-Amphidinium_carterae.2